MYPKFRPETPPKSFQPVYENYINRKGNQTCVLCHKEESYFYECACKPKRIICVDCLVKRNKDCPLCNQKYVRYSPPGSQTAHMVNYGQYNLTGGKIATNHPIYQNKKEVKVTQLQNSFKQSPILDKKPQKDYSANKQDMQYHNIKKQELLLDERRKKTEKILSNSFNYDFSIDQRNQPLPSKNTYNEIPFYQANMIRGNLFNEPKQFQRFPQETNSKFQNPHEMLQSIKRKLWSAPYEKEKPQTKNLTVYESKNSHSLYKQNEGITTKLLTKEEQLKEIMRFIQKKKGYFDTKCQKLYQLYELAQVIDNTKEWSSIVTLPNCNCIQKKQFVLTLLKDKCLICAGQKKYQNQRYELKNGFCICNNCQALVNSQDQNPQNYIKPLLYQCLACEHFKIKKTKKQMHNPQNKNKDDLEICNQCFENSISREKRINQQKEHKIMIEEENRKREEQNQRRLEENRRRREEQNRKWQEQSRRRQQEDRREREKFQQQDFQRQLKIIQLRQQTEKIQKEIKQQEERQQQRRKQERQKRKQNQELQKRNKYEMGDRVNHLISNKRFQYVKQSRQKEIKRTYQSSSSDKKPQDYQFLKSVACDGIITSHSRGTQVDGALICQVCSITNKSELFYPKSSKRSQSRNKFEEKFENKGKMRIEDEKLYNNGRQQILNKFSKNVYQYKPRIQEFKQFDRSTFNKQVNSLKTSKVRKLKNLILYHEPKEDDPQKLDIKIKQQQKEESPANQQYLTSQQKIPNQQIDQDQNNNDSSMACGECNSPIDSLEKLGIKNQNGLILCNKCFELQKSRIQDEEQSSSNFQDEKQSKSTPSKEIQRLGKDSHIEEYKGEERFYFDDQFSRDSQENRQQFDRRKSKLQEFSFESSESIEQKRENPSSSMISNQQNQQKIIVRPPPNFYYQYENEHQQQPNLRSITIESSRLEKNGFQRQDYMMRNQQDSIQHDADSLNFDQLPSRMRHSPYNQLPMLSIQREEHHQFQHFSGDQSFFNQQHS